MVSKANLIGDSIIRLKGSLTELKGILAEYNDAMVTIVSATYVAPFKNGFTEVDGGSSKLFGDEIWFTSGL